MIPTPKTVRNLQLWEKHCRQLKAYADRVAAGEIDILEGSIRILVFQVWLHAHDDRDFEAFRKVSDAAIGLPIGKERAHWQADALAKKDMLIDAIRRRHQGTVRSAASKIGEKYWCPKKRPTSR
ncbi:MAG TPA: hypothetical protein VHC20_06590 [Candidatus Paceibacterota bacterium]|nr:hypothetical protein [Candidatus Paceibacterota bacterium]